MANVSRDGKCLSTGAQPTWDHDYEHLSQGKVIPHGIFDLKNKTGYMSIPLLTGISSVKHFQ
jgi:hypothetical protein